MDARFAGVLAPFAPHARRVFVQAFGKPSAGVLEACADTLAAMRHALETYYRQLESLETEHLACLAHIRSADVGLTTSASHTRNTTNDDDEQDANTVDCDASALDNVSAQQYEDAQRSWSAVLTYATTTPRVLQIGVLLIDQRAFVDRVSAHAARRVREMDDALPGLYKRFLRDLLAEVDGKIERVTKIPTTLADATEWLTHVMAMLPSHAFRQRLDAKCANVAKLRALLHERLAARTTASAESVDTSDASLHKLELEWESTFETLMVCLARVQDRDSEHRRSFYDLAVKTEAYVSAQLERIKTDFQAIPLPRSLQDASAQDATASATAVVRRRKKEQRARADDIVERLEALVELDTERRSVAQQFALYERELRAVAEQQLTGAFAFVDITDTAAATLAVDESTLPSELLLQRVVTALDLRKWFTSWTALVDKWSSAPLQAIHAEMVLTRVRQFRRRLLYASSRLFRSTPLDRTPPSGASETETTAAEEAYGVPAFLANDFALTRAFDESIEAMATDCRIFQALSGGAFTDERWQVVDAMLLTVPSLEWTSAMRSSLTLRTLKTVWGASPSMAAFLALCDQVIVEAKVHRKVAQTQRQLAQLSVVVVETHYALRCDNIHDVLSALEDLLVSAKLFLHEHNPALDVVLGLCTDLEHKIAVCEQLARFQDQWRDVCDVAKLHDTDEFFTARKVGALDALGTADASGQWLALKAASQAWTDRMRRAFCQNTQATATADATATSNTLSTELLSGNVDASHSGVSTHSVCSLDDLVAAFDGFEFDESAQSCEAGVALLRSYLDALRALAPRLYALSDAAFIQLLVHEDDVAEIRQSLAICFPSVDAFTIGGSDTRTDIVDSRMGLDSVDTSKASSTSDEGASPQSNTAASNTAGPIVIRGIESSVVSLRAEFALAVLKIGRVKFWFSRLEEEMAALVTRHVRSAVASVLGAGHTTCVAAVLMDQQLCQSLLPQAIALALQLRFRHHVDRALAHYCEAPRGQETARLDVFEDLVRQTEASIEHLARVLRKPPTGGLCRADARVESVVLLCVYQRSVLRHITNCLRQSEDEALRFWSMQLTLRLSLDVSTRSMTKASRLELETKLQSFKSGVATQSPLQLQKPWGLASDSAGAALAGVQFHAHVAHMELPIGHEFVGSNRLAVVAPLAERCVFAIVSAMRTHALALAVPHVAPSQNFKAFELLTAVSQVVMKPSLAFECGPRVASLDRVEQLVHGAEALGGVVCLHGFLSLPASLRSACRELLVQMHHKHQSRSHAHHTAAAPAATTAGGASSSRSLAAMVFIPLMSSDSLEASGFVASLQTPFRPLALVAPAIRYFVDALLLLDGFTPAQADALQLSTFFEAFAAAEAELVHTSMSSRLVPSVLTEARRLRTSFRAVSATELASGARLSPSPSWRDSSLAASDQFSASVEQCLLERAIRAVVAPALLQRASSAHTGTRALARRFEMLLTACFPLGASLRLVVGRFRGGSREDDVAGALTICLEHSRLAQSDAQINVAMDVWRALQHGQRHAVLLYGLSGSGKTTCIKTLHRALCALEYTEAETLDAQTTDSSSSRSELVVVNPALLSFDELYGAPASLHATQASAGLLKQLLASSARPAASAYARQHRTWILVDTSAQLGGSAALWLEPLLCLLSSGMHALPLLDGTCADVPVDVRNRVRLVFETMDLRDVSPRLLADCWSAHVPMSAVTHRDILGAWQQTWTQRLVFPVGSRAAQNLSTVFTTTDVLLSTICVQFIQDETARSDSSSANTGESQAPLTPERGEGESSRTLRLGWRSMNHMTQTALALVTSLCLEHRASLEDLSHGHVTLVVCFAVLWGVAGHLSDTMKHKLELFVRGHAKSYAMLKHVAEVPGSLFSGDHFASVWDSLQPVQYRPGRSLGAGAMSLTDSSSSSSHSNSAATVTSDQLVFDPNTAQYIVVTPATRTLVRICRQLLRSSHSFLVTGASASGKTTLLRLLQTLNDNDVAAEVMVDASIDERQAHAILDWLEMPSAWFRLTSIGAALDASGARCSLRDEAQLFTSRTTTSIAFLDDLGADVASGDMADHSGTGAQEEFVRFVLDHRMAFSRKTRAFEPVDKDVGAAMRIDSDDSVSDTRMSPSLVRLLRHFAVFHVPSYDRKQLLSVFRAKFHASFAIDPRASTAGSGSSSSVHDTGERLLSMEETALRASIDLHVEMSAIQLAMRATSADEQTAAPSAFVFNLHHTSALLERTLAFASSLREHERSTSSSTSLLALGKLHQCWMSEVRNLFLLNASEQQQQQATRQSAGTGTGAAAAPTPPVPRDVLASTTDSSHDSVAKTWAALRLISEKYFSVSLRDDVRVLADIESVYFTLQLASKYAQLAAGPQLAVLREILTTNASASSSSTRHRSRTTPGTGAGTQLDRHARESTSETILRLLLQLATATSWSSSSLPARSYRADDLSTLDVTLLLGSSFGLSKTLHLLHALDAQRHIVIRAPPLSQSTAESLLRFACDAHGLVIKRLRCKELESLDAQRALDETLRGLLHAAVIQNERLALWIDCDDARALEAPAGTHALVDLVRELSQHQVPSLLLRSGALRDAAVLRYVQSQPQLAIMSEAAILCDVVKRVQRNLRLCVFVDSSRGDERVAGEHERRMTPLLEAPARVQLDWMQTRERVQWFCFERIEDVDAAMMEIAHVAVRSLQLSLSPVCSVEAPQLTPTAPHSTSTASSERDATGLASLTATLCHRIHITLTAPLVVPLTECVQLHYFLSFLKNVVVLHQRRTNALDARIGRYERMLETLRTKQQHSQVLDARAAALRAQLVELQQMHDAAAESAERHRAQVREDRLRSRRQQSNASADDDDLEYEDDDEASARAIAAAAALSEYVLWTHRARCEELALAIADATTELDEVSRRLCEWRDVADIEHQSMSKWSARLTTMQSPAMRSKVLADALLESALMTYAFVSALPQSSFVACVERVKALLTEFDPASSSSPAATVSDSECPASSDDKTVAHDRESEDDYSDSDDADRRLAQALWSAQFRFLRHCPTALDTLARADALCDRIPVFVDTTGLLQRFFLHFFSGGALTAASAMSMGDRDVVWRDTSHAAMIVSSDGEHMDAKLHEAQRRNVPVLLINVDLVRALPTLLPLVEHVSGHRRQSVLTQLTTQSYDAHLSERDVRRTKKKQPSVCGVAIPTLSSGDKVRKASLVSASESAVPRPVGRKKFGAAALSTELAAAAVAASDASHHQQQQQSAPHRASNTAATTSTPPPASAQRAAVPVQHLDGSGFQVYAVSSTPIALETQHALAMHFAVFDVPLSAAALESVFLDVYTRAQTPKLDRELLEIDATLIESAHRCRQLETRLTDLLVSRVHAPVALETLPWIRSFFDHYASAPTYWSDWSLATRRHRTETYLLRERRDEVLNETKASASLARELVAVATSMTAVRSLAGAHSRLYTQSLRWLEHALEQQLYAPIESTRRLDTPHTVLDAIVQQLVAGLASTSHRQLFVFLLTVEREAARGAQCSAYKRVIELLSDAIVPQLAHTHATSGATLSGPRAKSRPSIAATLDDSSCSNTAVVAPLPQATSQSMVERLRRKVRLCAFIFDPTTRETESASASAVAQSNRRASRYATAAKPSSAKATLSAALSNGRRSTRQPLSSPVGHHRGRRVTATRLSPFDTTVTRQLSDLLVSVDAYWSDWRQRKRTAKHKLQGVLQALGVDRSRLQRRASVSVTDPQLSPSAGVVTLVDWTTELRTASSGASALGANGAKRLEQHMTRLVLAKTLYPDAFADAMDAYIGDSSNTVVMTQSMDIKPSDVLAPRLLSQNPGSSVVPRRASSAIPATPMLVTDIVPARSGHDRVHLPSRVVVYDKRTRDAAETMVASWTHDASTCALTVHHWDTAALRTRFAALVTSSRCVVVELVRACDLDRLVSLVSHVIQQHATLAPPSWIVVAALPIAIRFHSSLLPVMAKSVLVHRALENPSQVADVIRRALMDRGVSESFAARWVARGLASTDTNASGACTGSMDTDAMTLPSQRDLDDLALQLRAIDDAAGIATLSERRRLEDALIELTTTGTIAQAPTSRRAAYSAELLNDLLLLRQSLALAAPAIRLDMDAPSSSTPLSAVDSAMDRIPAHVLTLCSQIKSLFELLREVFAARALQQRIDSSDASSSVVTNDGGFVPWHSLADEFAAHWLAFMSVYACVAALETQTRAPRALLSLEAQREIASLSSGRMPFKWMARAFTHTVGPSTAIAVPQLALLVACRLGMLVRCLQAHNDSDDTDRSDGDTSDSHGVTAINLAALSDARAFLAAMRAYCAAQRRVSVDDVVLVLDIEPLPDDDVDEDEDDEASVATQDAQSKHPLGASEHCRDAAALPGPKTQLQSTEQRKYARSALTPALICDSTGAPCGIRVDGLVVIEQSVSSASGVQTHLSALPLCRLYCATERELAALEQQDATALAAARTDVDASSGNSSLKRSDATEAALAAVKTVPLVMLPSLSPYQTPPRVLSDEKTCDAVLDASVRLRFALTSALPALRRDSKSVAFAIGAPMFPDDELDERESASAS